jgi:hypothetical protein
MPIVSILFFSKFKAARALERASCLPMFRPQPVSATQNGKQKLGHAQLGRATGLPMAHLPRSGCFGVGLLALYAIE